MIKLILHKCCIVRTTESHGAVLCKTNELQKSLRLFVEDPVEIFFLKFAKWANV